MISIIMDKTKLLKEFEELLLDVLVNAEMLDDYSCEGMRKFVTYLVDRVQELEDENNEVHNALYDADAKLHEAEDKINALDGYVYDLSRDIIKLENDNFYLKEEIS
jgi:hypothetical protein